MYGNGEIVQVLVVYDTESTNLSVVETFRNTSVLDLRAASLAQEIFMEADLTSTNTNAKGA